MQRKKKAINEWFLDELIKFIEEFEGCKLKAYKCSAGVLTIGIGHTKGVKEGDRITLDEAYQLLKEDLREVIAGLSKIVSVDVTQGQFIAITSLAFNVGVGAIKRSKLIRKLNLGDTEGAAVEFLDWDKCNGKRVPGLTRRRKREYKLFTSGKNPI